MVLGHDWLHDDLRILDESRMSSAVAFFIKNIGATYTLQKNFLSLQAVRVQKDGEVIVIRFSSNFDNIAISINSEGHLLSATNLICSDGFPGLIQLDPSFAKSLLIQLSEKLIESSPDNNLDDSIVDIQRGLLSRILGRFFR